MTTATVTCGGPNKITFGLAYTPTFPAASAAAASEFPTLNPGESTTVHVSGVQGIVIREVLV